MPKVRVAAIAISVDGFAAGPNQSLENPLGVRGPEIFESFFATKFFRQMFGQEGGETGVDHRLGEESFANVGAWILGRNMFGPVRGPWPDESWRGWWGEEPSYHKPVFVLTHHARRPLEMKGGTTFHFVTEGIHVALERAMKAAAGADVRIGGGVSTLRQYFNARLVEEAHFAMAPVLLGVGENLFQGLDLHALGYECHRQVAGERATHLFVRRRG